MVIDKDIFKPMGVYYDDPGNLKDPNSLRACCGFLIPKDT